MTYQVGCVPFVNAKPLITCLDGAKVAVRLDVPSRLPAMLDSGEVQAVLASSFDALTTPGRRIVWGVCIGSFGPADSVRLFSKVPFEHIKTLALDQSSLTSNHLAQILLRELYSCHLENAETAPPDLERMLETNDACILIGDKGMMADGSNYEVLDLGEAWTRMTGLPFVWAVWIGNEALDPYLARELNQAFQAWLEIKHDLIPSIAQEAGWLELTTATYLEQTMHYRFGDHEWAGLMRYRDLLVKHGFAQTSLTPSIVHYPGDSPEATG